MGAINAVMGEVKGDDLGVVDYHEHLCFNAPPWLLREDRDFKLDDVERSAAELRDWTAAGGADDYRDVGDRFWSRYSRSTAHCAQGARGADHRDHRFQ